MSEKLPEGNDLYGYDGISKEALLASIGGAYSLSHEILPNDEARFEVISLKRAGSALYKTLKDFFDLDEQSSKKRNKFDEFLNDLSALVEKTRLTYLIVVKNGIRDDEELSRLRQRITEFAAVDKDLIEVTKPIEGKVDEIVKAATIITEAHNNIDKQQKEIVQWHARADEHYAALEKISTKAEDWDEEIKTAGTQYQVLLKQIEDLTVSAERRRDELRNYSETGKEISETLIASSTEHKKLLDEINKILGDANRVGMAAAFKARKDELARPQTVWQVTFICAIVAIVIAVLELIIPSLIKGETTMIAVEAALVAPLIWLGWFAAEQYSYTSKIREDYAFKAAAAMSYEGHKNAAREVNKELESLLLNLSLFNISQNPIRLYGDSVHSTPIHKLAESCLASIFGKRKTSDSATSVGQTSEAESPPTT